MRRFLHLAWHCSVYIPILAVLVQREMDFCLIGVNRKWVTVTNLF
jgi:hypothetical protein